MKLLVVYTYNLRGDEATLTHVLPRLHTFIRDTRRGVPWNAPTSTRFLLLDLGNSCAPDVWPCDVTGGRSTLIVLDAMGYQAANASHLSPESRAKLSANLLQMALVDDAHDWQDGDIWLTTGRGVQLNAPTDGLHIILAPADATRLEGRRLHLAAAERGQLGVAQVGLGETATLDEHAILDLPPGTLPDPTIAAAVEFVLGEARYYQRK